MKKISLAISLFILFSFVMKGQENKIHLITQSDENGVLLRWAPSNKGVSDWVKKNGVNIERTTLKINGKLNPNPEKVILNQSPIIALTEDNPKWEANSEDKYSLVAWQFLHKELPEENMKGSITSQLLYKQQNQSMSFGFYLLAVDFSKTAAELSGLYFEDKTTVKGNEYFYKVMPALANESMTITPGISVNSPGKEIDFPLIRKPLFSRKDKRIDVNWDINFLNYTGYIVEKSTNNKKFIAINEDPIVSISEIDQKIVSYQDTNVEFGKTYYYRIKGINSFATQSSPSKSIEIEVYEQLIDAPKIKEATPLDEAVEIEWEWNEKSKDRANMLYLTRSEKVSGPYEIVSKNIYRGKNKVKDDSPFPGNYYQFVAKNKQGDSVVSTPIFVQLKDDKPPLAPEGLSGVIDSNGIVTITWKPNKERDINGYRVFRANYENHEFSQVTIGACKDSVYYDTIPLNNLTNTIFYKISAVDFHFNPSEFSKTLELEKPDTIAPISPLFTNYKSDGEGVKLTWINSSSSDIANHILYKKTKQNTNWEEVTQFLKKETTYYDSLKTEDYTVYKIVAVDKAGLFSKNPKTIEVKKVNPGYSQLLPEYEVIKDEENNKVVISWSLAQKGIERVQIFRNKDDKGMRLVKTVDFKEKEYSEKSIKIGAIYEYRIKYILTNGKESKFSELKRIQ